MPTVRYTADGGHYRVGGHGFDPGDTKDVGDELADYLADRDDFDVEGADGTDGDESTETGDAETTPDDVETKGSVVTAPAEFTIDDIEAELETGEWDDYLETLRENEEEGKGRSGVYDAIGERRAELED